MPICTFRLEFSSESGPGVDHEVSENLRVEHQAAKHHRVAAGADTLEVQSGGSLNREYEEFQQI